MLKKKRKVSKAKPLKRPRRQTITMSQLANEFVFVQGLLPRHYGSQLEIAP